MPEDKVIPVRVALRCRPMIPREKDEGCLTCMRFTPNVPQVILGKDRAFTYDYVFSPTVYQPDVYDESVKPLVNNIFKGYNATVLAYGQTGSGKTYTMGGCYEASIRQNEDLMGVIPRALRGLFEGIEQQTDFEFLVKVSYLEIYNEELHDLLRPPSKREALAIREDENGGIKIQGLREVAVGTYEETMKCLVLGSEGRTTGATAMNDSSSRSHAIFTLHISRKKKDDMSDLCQAKFHLVDLAGSERQKRTHAEGERLKEGININRGLLSLGNVISALGEESQKRNHIPYRDSKLTRLLQDSLGGNSHTLMIACVSPADSNMEESLNTLRYADRARKIKNKPIVNRDPQAAEIMRLKEMVQQLQLQMIHSDGGIGVTVSASIGSDHGHLLEKIKQLEEENANLTGELQRAVSQSTNLCEKTIKLEMKCEKLKQKLQDLKTTTGIDLGLLTSSFDTEANPQLKEQLNKLQVLVEKVSEAQAEEEKTEDSADPDNEEDTEEEVPETPDSRALSKQFTLRQAQMNRELQDLNRLLSQKETLASQMTHNDDKIEQIKKEYETTTKDLEAEINGLQKEKDELNQQLQNARVNTAATKISEQRRKRLQELEQQMAQLKKKLNEQTKLVRLKDQSDKQVTRLNLDIQGLKQQRVKLMKQMKEDSENFRKWKQQKDKEVMQLIQKDRKRQCEVQKMQRDYEKSQNVLKRKAEEAAVANKRLKDALVKQKTVVQERSKKLEKYDSTSIGNRVRSWLSHELEVRVSIREAKYHLESLLRDRKVLSEQLKQLKDKLEDGPPSKKLAWEDKGRMSEASFERDDVQKQITTLETDIDLRNAQISDLQQKIVDADQECKGKSVWESLHTMTEAKCALKWLLEQTVSTKADVTRAQTELKDYKENNDDNSNVMEKLEEQIEVIKKKHQAEMTAMQKESEAKVLFLLRQLKSESSENNTSLDEDTKRRLKFQEEQIEKLGDLHEELEKRNEECEALKKQLTRAMYQGKSLALMPSITEPGSSPFLTPTLKVKSKRQRITKKEASEGPTPYEEYLEEWEEIVSSDSEPDDKDVSWTRTPVVGKRGAPKTQRNSKSEKPRQSANIWDSLDSNNTSTETILCRCNGSCSSKKCSCQKNSLKCSEKCLCKLIKCTNREVQQPESTTPDLSLETSQNTSQQSQGSSLMNTTFCMENKGSDMSPSSPTQARGIQRLLSSGSRSSDEFVKPRPALKNLVKNGEDSGNSSMLDGGLRKKRKLLSANASSSYFSPLV